MILLLEVNCVHVLPKLSLLDVPHLAMITGSSCQVTEPMIALTSRLPLMINSLAMDLLMRIQASQGLEHRSALGATDVPRRCVDLAMSLQLVAIFTKFLADLALIDLLAVDFDHNETFVEILFALVGSFVDIPRRFLDDGSGFRELFVHRVTGYVTVIAVVVQHHLEDSVVIDLTLDIELHIDCFASRIEHQHNLILDPRRNAEVLVVLIELDEAVLADPSVYERIL